MRYSQVRGASLLEVMIALLLSAIILTEIFRYSYFLESSMSFSAKKIEAIEKNNVLFAWMARDIEMAGYVGCVNAFSRKGVIDDGGYLSSIWLSANGDVLKSQYMSTQQFAIMSKTNSNEVLIDGDNDLKANDVVFIENCWAAEVIKIKKISSVNYGVQNRLQFYSEIKLESLENAYVAKLIRHEYIIKKTTRKNAQGEYILSLYVIDEKNNSDEILENIVSMALKKLQNNITISMIDNEKHSFVVVAKAHNAS